MRIEIDPPATRKGLQKRAPIMTHFIVTLVSGKPLLVDGSAKIVTTITPATVSIIMIISKHLIRSLSRKKARTTVTRGPMLLTMQIMVRGRNLVTE